MKTLSALAFTAACLILSVSPTLADAPKAKAPSCIPQPQCLGGFKPVTTTAQASKSLTSGILAGIVPQLQATDWYASQLSGGSGADSVLDPYAHACLPVAIAWIQSIPTLAPMPAPPAGTATGPFVDFEIARIKAMQADALANQIGQAGLPTSLKLACAAYLQSVDNLPFKLANDFTIDFANFVTSVGAGLVR